jgi:hypothetical protein
LNAENVCLAEIHRKMLKCMVKVQWMKGMQGNGVGQQLIAKVWGNRRFTISELPDFFLKGLGGGAVAKFEE